MSRAIVGAGSYNHDNHQNHRDHGVTSNSRTRLGIYHSNRGTAGAYEKVNSNSSYQHHHHHPHHQHEKSLSINHYANNIYSRENLNPRDNSLGKTTSTANGPSFGAHRASLMQVNPVNLR